VKYYELTLLLQDVFCPYRIIPILQVVLD